MKNTNEPSNKRTDFLLLGIFFLVWSINGYFVAGNILKMGLLVVGFGLITRTSFTLPKHRKFVNFSLISFAVLLLYWIVAVIRNQRTASMSILIFDVICFLLLLSGYIVGRNLSYFKKVSPKVIIFISLMTIFGGYMFIKYQSQLLLESVVGGNTRTATEDGDESGINVIGIAYTNAILFFIQYYFVVYYDLKKWVRWLLFLSMFSIVFVILSTQSRGALIYIFLFQRK